MKKQKTISILISLFILGIIVSLFVVQILKAQTGIPQVINYHGKLKDVAGNPLTGTYNFTFRLYDASTGGNMVWGPETHNSVAVTNGYFNVKLGSVLPFNLDFIKPYWLSIKVGADPEMTPRIPLTTFGYAFTAQGLYREGANISIKTVSSGNIILESAGNIQLLGGNVGIGTPTPTSKLSVAGRVNINSLLLEASGNQEEGGIGEIKNREVTGVAAEGKAVRFDGSDDYVDLGNAIKNLDHSSKHTYLFWIKTTHIHPYYGSILTKGRFSVNANHFIWNGTGTLSIYTQSAPSDISSAGTYFISDGTWHHIAVIFNEGYVSYYVDGVQRLTPTYMANMGYNNLNNGRLGTYYDGTMPWDGDLDEVRSYGKVLTEAEIIADYNAGQGTYGQPVSGLEAGWHFDEGSGIIAADYSGNGHTATLVNGVAWIEGKVPGPAVPGKAVKFNGISQYINIPNSSTVALENNLSVTFWAKYVPPGNYVYIICKKNSFWGQTNGYLSYFNAGPSGYIDMIGRGDAFKRHNLSPDENWHHYALIWQGTNWLVYQDANLVSGITHGTPQPVIAGTDELWIGRRDAGTGGYAAGLIDEIKLYDIALTQAQITADYNAGQGTYGQPGPNLKAGWHLDEGTGILAADYSGNNNTGTLVNGAEWVDGKITTSGTIVETRYAFRRGRIGDKNRLFIGDTKDDEIVLNKPLLKSPVENLTTSVGYIFDTEKNLTISGAKLLSIRNQTVEKFIIDKDGNVGIGTTSPAEKLDVAGTTKMAGFKMPTGAMAGYVLTSDALGVGAWQAGGVSWPLLAPDGTITAPSYSFTNNSNLGIFRPAVDTLAFSTAGSERLRIDASGNVGIGTTDPTVKLHLKSASLSVPGVRVENGTGMEGYGFNHDGSALRITTLGSDFNDIILRTSPGSDNSDKLIVKADTGNVGIGTTDPTVKLHLKSASLAVPGVRVENGTGMEGYGFNHDGSALRITTLGSDFNDIILRTSPGSDNSDKLIVKADTGNVGIGTTDPEQRLHVVGNQVWRESTDADTSGIGLFLNFPSGFHQIRTQGIGGGPIRGLAFGSSAIPGDGIGMVMTNAGNLGIRTTSPGANLHIVRNIDDYKFALGVESVADGRIGLKAGDLATKWASLTMARDGTNRFFIQRYGGTFENPTWEASVVNIDLDAPDQSLVLDGNGNVGIGTTGPLRKLSIVDSGVGLDRPAPNVLGFYTDNLERMRIDSFGNLGIRTTSPGANLHIVRNIDDYKFALGVESVADGRIGLKAGDLATKWASLTMARDGTNRFFIQRYGGTFENPTWEASVVNIDLDAPDQSLVLDGNGNVGIGTANPQAKLDVAGNLMARNNVSIGQIDARATKLLNVLGGDAIQRDAIILLDSVDGLDGGQSAYMEINSNVSGGADNAMVRFKNDGVEQGRIGGADGGLVFWSGGGIERMRIDAAGNVGIGTTSPGVKLEVVGDVISKGTSWTIRVNATNNWWESVTYGNGLFVAVASDVVDNKVMTSPDGINWTSRTIPVNNAWYSVTYGNGLFVAVADSGTGNRVMTSPDGINWTIRTSAADNGWHSVTYGNGLFVAVAETGIGNRVMTSPDGINWTIRTSAADIWWQSVTYGNGLFVAVAASGIGNRVMTSPDGINWTSRTSAADNGWLSVTYGNGLFVAVAYDGVGANDRIMTSPDGINWTIRTNPVDNEWHSVTYGNGLFVAVASSGIGNRIMTSPDGINWTSRTSPVNIFWRSVIYGNGLFVAIASDGTGNGVMTSGKSEINAIATNNIYQGGMSIFGNVGIGRAPITNRLEVEGDASKTTAGDWLANSDLFIKTDIETIEGLSFLSRLNPVKFRYTDEYRTLHPNIEDRFYYNFIAQEFAEVFPDAVKGSGEFLANGHEILQLDPYVANIVAIKAIQEQQKQIEELKLQLNSNGSLAGSESTDESESSLSFTKKVKQALTSLGLFIENGIARIEKLFTKEIVVEKILTDEITAKRIKMIDKATGEIYCAWIENGEWIKMKGECGTTASVNPPSMFKSPISSEPATPSELPISSESPTSSNQKQPIP